MTSRNIRSLIVNGITLARLPLIFIYLFFAVISEYCVCGCVAAWMAGFAALFMFLAAISDLFDGMFARKWNVVSAFGKMADPLMDKVFFIVAYPSLLWMAGHHGDIRHALSLLVFTILWILRDQWVTFLRSVAAAYHADVSAMWLGKVRTALSFPAAGFIFVTFALSRFVPNAISSMMVIACLILECALTLLNVYSCVVYTHVYMPYLRRALGKE